MSQYSTSGLRILRAVSLVVVMIVVKKSHVPQTKDKRTIENGWEEVGDA